MLLKQHLLNADLQMNCEKSGATLQLHVAFCQQICSFVAICCNGRCIATSFWPGPFGRPEPKLLRCTMLRAFERTWAREEDLEPLSVEDKTGQNRHAFFDGNLRQLFET